MRIWKHHLVEHANLILPAIGLMGVVALAWRMGGATDARAAGGPADPRSVSAAAVVAAAAAPAPVPAPAPAKPAPAAKGAAPGSAVSNPHGDLRIACETCHTAESWTAMRTPSAFDHSKTGFPLDGKHRTASCKDCHGSLVFARVATSCADCHRDVHEGRNGLRCQDCHVPVRWVDRSDAVRRHASTSFPLKGVHAILECSRCHVGQDETHITKTASECFACHSAEYAATKSPNHVAAGYSTRCETCHDAGRATWTGSGFDHAMTGFALDGAHRSLACTACHTGGNFQGLAKDCASCHQAQYAATTNPNHQAAGFNTQCATCHTTRSWAGAVFDHATQTSFPLTGAHARATCVACHSGGQFANTPTDCYACHRTNFETAASPNHVAGGFPTTCTTCHTTSAWQPSSFNHSTTAFPLTGAHASVSCTQCHGSGQYAGTPTNCYACHRANYEATTNPNHVTAGYSTTCTTCHNTSAWQPANFDHSQTRFPLTGAHASVTCTQCHGNGQFTGTPTDCYACHRTNYEAATNPNHVSAGFPTTCTTCHTTTAWQPSSFNHSTTAFPLTGAHASVTCTQCHGSGQYAGTPTDCYACHRANYDATTNPNHAAAGFNTGCATCHTTTAWQPATFNHDSFFRISTSPHNVSCNSCHLNPSNYADFSCTVCHGQTQTASHHTGVSGYRYDSAACYSCHRR